MTFIQYFFSCNGIKVDPQKIEVVKWWPRPTTSTNIQSFVGLARYYKRFVESFSSYSYSIDEVNSKKGKGLIV